MKDQHDDNPFESPTVADQPEAFQPNVSIEKSQSVVGLARLAWQMPTLGGACYVAAVALAVFYPSIAPLSVPLLFATAIFMLLGLAFTVYAASWNKQVPEAGMQAGFGLGATLLLFFLILLGCAGIAVIRG